MTKKERKKLVEAIRCFTDDDPNKWVDGMNILCLLIYDKTWEEIVGLTNLKSIEISKLSQILKEQRIGGKKEREKK